MSKAVSARSPWLLALGRDRAAKLRLTGLGLAGLAGSRLGLAGLAGSRLGLACFWLWFGWVWLDSPGFWT